jgi:hypothetical protein
MGDDMDPKAAGEANRHEEAHLDRLSTETDLIRAGVEHTRARAALLKAFAGLVSAIMVILTLTFIGWVIVGALAQFGVVHPR